MDIQQLFEKFNGMKALIIGDVMIDSYVWGKVSRISPEAPVPIVSVSKNEMRLGGAANVALNIKALGAQPIICSVIGNDLEARSLMQLMRDEEIGTDGLVKSPHRTTTIKHRIMAASQHILRVDSEIDTPIVDEQASLLIEKIAELMVEADVMIFEDYDKGVLTEQVIREVIAIANKQGVPTVVDPKKRNFLHYAGSTLFKPNLKELKEGVKLEFENGDFPAIAKAVAALNEMMPIESALITLSEHGVYITNHREEYNIPAHKREISDVSGAGDTVVSVASLCLAAGQPLEQIAGIANLGGGLVCEHLGVVPIDKQRLLQESLRYYA